MKECLGVLCSSDAIVDLLRIRLLIQLASEVIDGVRCCGSGINLGGIRTRGLFERVNVGAQHCHLSHYISFWALHTFVSSLFLYLIFLYHLPFQTCSPPTNQLHHLYILHALARVTFFLRLCIAADSPLLIMGRSTSIDPALVRGTYR